MFTALPYHGRATAYGVIESHFSCGKEPQMVRTTALMDESGGTFIKNADNLLNRVFAGGNHRVLSKGRLRRTLLVVTTSGVWTPMLVQFVGDVFQSGFCRQ